MKQKPPLKLMPLDEFGKLVGRIARVPKDVVVRDSRKRAKRRKKATAIAKPPQGSRKAKTR